MWEWGSLAEGVPRPHKGQWGARQLSPIMTTLRMKLLISCSSWGPNASSSPAVTSTQPTAVRYPPGSGTNPKSFRGNTLAKHTNSDAWEGWEGSEAALSLGLGGYSPSSGPALRCPVRGISSAP